MGRPDEGAGGGEREFPGGTIAFATVGRSAYAFDLYGVSLPAEFVKSGGDVGKLKDERITDGISVNTNGHLVEGIAKKELLQWIKKRGGGADDSGVLDAAVSEDALDLLIYVTERDGALSLYFSVFIDQLKHAGTLESLFQKWGGISGGSKQQKQEKDGSVLLAKSVFDDTTAPQLQDRPQIGGGRIVFVSTEQADDRERKSWTAVYSTTYLGAASKVVRLTPKGVSDYSPSLSPSGKWVIVASSQDEGWQGEVAELQADLYVFDAADGSKRRLVVKNAGWPSWSDESTVYFHRKAEDGWWSVFRISLPDHFLTKGEGKVAEESRVTPPGLHAFTPAPSRTGGEHEWIAVATRRPGSSIRHIEIFDLRSQTFIKLTENISPGLHHYNPFVSASSNRIVYHRCRGNAPIRGEASIVPRLEPLKSGVPGLALLRVHGTFPTFSPDGSLIAFVPGSGGFDVGVAVTRLNGEGMRKIYSGLAFGTVWDQKRKDVVYAASGAVFASELTAVHIISIFGADAGFSETESVSEEPKFKVLTKEGTGNNAFPSPSPDGKHVVFRSGRNGHKNLYIMDAVDGEEAELRQLTDGEWTDTMPHWSPTGEWIAFSSTRRNPEASHFDGYLIHPDGSGLRKILGDGGRVNHLAFSPDGNSLVFTADFAAVSAEPISLPNQFQPYGEIFISKLDGSGIRRLTHNAYEDGTPAWGPIFVDSSELSSKQGEPVTCGFADDTFLSKGGEVKEEEPPILWCPRVRRPNRT